MIDSMKTYPIIPWRLSAYDLAYNKHYFMCYFCNQLHKVGYGRSMIYSVKFSRYVHRSCLRENFKEGNDDAKIIWNELGRK